MTVAAAGVRRGRLATAVRERGVETDQPEIALEIRQRRLNSDLKIGTDGTRMAELRAKGKLCSPGVKLHGSGFVLTSDEARRPGLGRNTAARRWIKPYLGGRDLVAKPRGLFVIDFFDAEADELRRSVPAIYQHVLETVKPERDVNRRAAYRDRWRQFGEPRRDLRPALKGLSRYIATAETSKHRVFQFVDGRILPDNMIVVVASDDAATLAVLSSRAHVVGSLALGGWLGVGNDPRYSKSRCFDPFPFPDPSPSRRARLAKAGEELDILRKTVVQEHPDLTITGLYNVLEKLRSREPLSAKDDDVMRRGFVLVLKDLRDEIDRLTNDAYGWPQTLADDAILERLAALNVERARDEAEGHVRWLRPDFQAPRLAADARRRGTTPRVDASWPVHAPAGRPSFPRDPYEHPLAVEAALAAVGRPLSSEDLVLVFDGRTSRRRDRLDQALKTLSLYGRVAALPDGRYAALRPH